MISTIIFALLTRQIDSHEAWDSTSHEGKVHDRARRTKNETPNNVKRFTFNIYTVNLANDIANLQCPVLLCRATSNEGHDRNLPTVKTLNKDNANTGQSVVPEVKQRIIDKF
mmetsp:Transcript_16058/g.37861  ORF Transcript_16058/g.37861 Transcript_16058/m.37861 type:complete len:112 (+) Transcript_16058:1773-2108(+)